MVRWIVSLWCVDFDRLMVERLHLKYCITDHMCYFEHLCQTPQGHSGPSHKLSYTWPKADTWTKACSPWRVLWKTLSGAGDDTPVNLQCRTNRARLLFYNHGMQMLMSKFLFIERILIDNHIVKWRLKENSILEFILIPRTWNEGERNSRALQPYISAIHPELPGNQKWYDGLKMKINIWLRILSDNKGLCLWSLWCYFTPWSPIYLFYDLSSPLERLLPALFPLDAQQPHLQGPRSSYLWHFLVLLPWLISTYPQTEDTAGLIGHYLWIILPIDLKLCHAVSASMCMRVSGGSALNTPKSLQGRGQKCSLGDNQNKQE